MIILGIDPGLATTGYGVIKLKINLPAGGEKLKVIDYGCIRTSVRMAYAERLETIYKEFKKIIKKYQPQCVAIEKIYFARNVKTAMQVGEARGIITLVAVQNKVPIIEFTPLQVKQCLTGYGQASKKQVQKMVKIILNLKEIPKPDDAADALAVAITCWQTKSL